jgi:hypothetical protein
MSTTAHAVGFSLPNDWPRICDERPELPAFAFAVSDTW